VFVRIAQWCFAVIVLGLVGETLNQYGSEGAAGYNVFASVITLLAVPWFIFAPRFLASTAHPLAAIILEYFLDVVWFTAWISEAGVWGPVNCNFYFVGFFGTVYTSSSISTGCKTAKAAAGIGALVWLLFLVSTFAVTAGSLPYLRTKNFGTPFTPFISGGIAPSTPAPVNMTPGGLEAGEAKEVEAANSHGIPEAPQNITPPEVAEPVSMPEPEAPPASAAEPTSGPTQI
jgi:hypothetical protein